MKSKINFQFPNQVTPRHIQSIFLKLEYGIQYSSLELREILRSSLDVEGKEIVNLNIDAWDAIGLGKRKTVKTQGKVIFFSLTTLGKQFQETYSTNEELFYELMHFLFYSTWKRSRYAKFGKFWLYSRVCDILWDTAPSDMDSYNLTGILQHEAQDEFPLHNPKFPVQSISAVFPWLGALVPPFLERRTTRSILTSKKRNYCSPQLFHLALDSIYNQKQLKYGTSMAIGDEEINSVCRVCLLDEGQFWEMADRTKMMIKGIEIRKGQYSTSLAIEQPPQWINLPDFSVTTEDISQNMGEDAE